MNCRYFGVFYFLHAQFNIFLHFSLSRYLLRSLSSLFSSLPSTSSLRSPAHAAFVLLVPPPPPLSSWSHHRRFVFSHFPLLLSTATIGTSPSCDYQHRLRTSPPCVKPPHTHLFSTRRQHLHHIHTLP